MVASLLIGIKSVLFGNFFRKTTFVLLTGILCLLELPVSHKSACGTNISRQQFLYELNHVAAARRELNPLERSHKLALSIHIIKTDDGDHGIDEEAVYKNVEELNKSFEPILMGFELTGINYINSSRLFDFSYLYDRELLEGYCIPNTINIFYVNDIVIKAGGDYCGFTHYPTAGKDFILLKNACVDNNTSLIHEMGHYFGLYHTHETSFGVEKRDGSDCNITGDLICDTPAEDILTSAIVAQQKPLNVEAEEGRLNFMSYARKDKRNTFTRGQYNKMVEVFCTFKSHLDQVNVDLIATDTLVYKGTKVRIATKGGVKTEWSTGDCSNEIVIDAIKDTLIEATICTVRHCVYKRVFIKVRSEAAISGLKSVKKGEELLLTVAPSSSLYSYQLYLNDKPYGEPRYGNGSSLVFRTWELHKNATFSVFVKRPGSKGFFISNKHSVSVSNN